MPGTGDASVDAQGTVGEPDTEDTEPVEDDDSDDPCDD